MDVSGKRHDPHGGMGPDTIKTSWEKRCVRFDSQVGSGFGKNIANWIGREKAYPSNVLHLSTETDNRSHSATFPSAIPEWFIRLFTKEGDWVLDPFVGSGTTCEAAQKLARNSVGIDVMQDYIERAREKIMPVKRVLL